MSRRVDVQVPCLAVRRDQAAAALNMGVDTFDRDVRPEVACVYVGSERRWAVIELQRWLDENGHRWEDHAATETAPRRGGHRPGHGPQEMAP